MPTPPTDSSGPMFKAQDREIYYEQLTPCTRSEQSQVCRLLRRLTVCNKILWHAGVELREDPQDNDGELRLISIPCCPVGCGWYDEKVYSKPPYLQLREAAITLLATLLASHRCIIAVTINDALAKEVTLIKAIRYMHSLRRLAICGDSISNPEVANNIYDLLKNMNNNEVPALPLQRPVGAPSQCSIPSTVPFHERSKLKAIDVSSLEMIGSDADDFTDALMKNSSVSELSVSSGMAMWSHEGSSQLFSQYLAHADGFLRKLVLKGCSVYDGPALQQLVNTIANMSNLRELDADVCRGDHMVLFAQVVAKNRPLQSLKLNSPKPCGALESPCGAHRQPELHLNTLRPWFSALQENTVLSRLFISLSYFKHRDCCNFLHAVARNSSLTSVVVASLPEGIDLQEVRSIIRQLRLSKRISFLDHVLNYADLPTLPDYPEMTALTVDYDRIPLPQLQRAVFNVLLTCCHHITSLRVHVGETSFFEAVLDPVATYIEEATALADFELHLDFDSPYQLENLESNPDFARPLVKALSINRNLRRISLKNFKLRSNECELLAGAILQSTRLSELELTQGVGSCDDVSHHHLVGGIEENYSLLNITLPISCWPPNMGDICPLYDGSDEEAAASLPLDCELYQSTRPAILDVVTSRNASLLTRAARFALGERDYINAAAFELVSEHPRLVEIIEERALVEAEQAAEMVRDALKRVNFISLDEFMKQIGVVRESVRRADGLQVGVMHLCDLNEYCWYRIRKHVRLSDVAGDGVFSRELS